MLRQNINQGGKEVDRIQKELEEKKKEIIIAKIIEILSNPCSNYTLYIKNCLDEMQLTIDSYFKICQSILIKSSRTKSETKLIYGYLFLMDDFIKLIKKHDEPHLNEYLQIIATHLGYEKLNKNSVLMRFGEKGKKAYIMLNGTIDILIKTSKKMKIFEEDYLKYLGNLIKYKEYGLVNTVVNDNFNVYPMEIIDDITNNIEFSGKPHHHFKSLSGESGLNGAEVPNNNHNDHINFIEALAKIETLEKKSKPKESFFHLNAKNSSIVHDKNIKKYKATELLSKISDKKQKSREDQPTERKRGSMLNSTALANFLGLKKSEINNVSTEDYISRLNICHDMTEEINSSSLSEFQKEKIKFSLFDLTIYGYIKIISRSTGALFGEVALSDPAAMRTATIITATDCHFGTLNKQSYNSSLKSGAEKQLRATLNFITSIEVFSGISIGILNKKYLNNFSKKNLIKGQFVVTQDSPSTSLSLLREGTYIISAYLSLHDITQIIKHYYEVLHKVNHIKFLEASEHACERMMKDNIKFKKFYYEKELTRINELNCPDIVGLDDYVQNGKILFDVECKSPSGEIMELSKNFYGVMSEKDSTVRTKEEAYLKKKNYVLAKRLNNIRVSKIQSFFDYKSEKDIIDNVVRKEIEEELSRTMLMKRKMEPKSVINNSKDIKLLIKGVETNEGSPQRENGIAPYNTMNAFYVPRSDRKINSIVTAMGNFVENSTVRVTTTAMRTTNTNMSYSSRGSARKTQRLQRKISMFKANKQEPTNHNKSVQNLNQTMMRKKSIIKKKISFCLLPFEILKKKKQKVFLNSSTQSVPGNKSNGFQTDTPGKPKVINFNDMIWEKVRPKINLPQLLQNETINSSHTSSRNKSNISNLKSSSTYSNTARMKFRKPPPQDQVVVDVEQYVEFKRKRYNDLRNQNEYKNTSRMHFKLGSYIKK